MKTCRKCDTSREESFFSKDKHKPDGLCTVCKICRVEYRKKYYSANSEKAKKESLAWFYENKNRAAESSKRYRAENSEGIRSARKAQYWKNPEAARAASSKYTLARQKVDVIYRLKMRCRKRIWAAFKENGYTKRSKSFDLIGCDIVTLTAHIENQFTAGMAWDNYGKWHIDHKVPFASASDADGIEKLCHYTNLQPLWASDNLRKSAKI